MVAPSKNKDAQQMPAVPMVDEEKFRVFRSSRTTPSSYFNLMLVINVFAIQDIISVYLVHFPYFTKLITLLSLFMLVIIGWILCYLKKVVCDEILMVHEYSCDYIHKCKLWMIHVEDWFVYTISFAAGMMVIFRSTYGECGDMPYMLRTASCNPEHACGLIPSDITAVALLVPLFFKIILKGASWNSIKLSVCIVVSMILYAIVVTSSYQSLYMVVICTPFVVIMLYEMRRQNVAVFLLTESLLATLEDNEKMADEMRLNEMKMMIGNVAHDLKTPLTAFLSGLDDVDATCHELKSQLKRMISRKFSKTNKVSFDATGIKTLLYDGIEKIKTTIKTSKSINSFMLMSINRCIDFTKVKHGVNLKAKMETFCLQEVLDVPLNCMRELQSAVDICVSPIPSTICTHIISDHQWFQENILCLASNAVKYSNKGTVTIKIGLWSPPTTDTKTTTTTNTAIITTAASTPSRAVTTPTVSWKDDFTNLSHRISSKSYHQKSSSSSSLPSSSSSSAHTTVPMVISTSSNSNKDIINDGVNCYVDVSSKRNQQLNDNTTVATISTGNTINHFQLGNSSRKSLRQDQEIDRMQQQEQNEHDKKIKLKLLNENELLIIGDTNNNHHQHSFVSGLSSPDENHYNSQKFYEPSSDKLSCSVHSKNRVSSRRSSFTCSPCASTMSGSNHKDSTLHCTMVQDDDHNDDDLNGGGRVKLLSMAPTAATAAAAVSSNSNDSIKGSNNSKKAQISPRVGLIRTCDTTIANMNHLHHTHPPPLHTPHRHRNHHHLKNSSSSNTNHNVVSNKQMEREKSYNLLSSLNIITNTTIATTVTSKSLLSKQPHQSPMYLRVEVEDQGIGIPEETMETLFSPFKQAQRLAGGTGLGLFSLAKRLEGLNGYYGVQKRSDGQQGSLFWFAFPYQPDKEMAKSFLAEKEKEKVKEKDGFTQLSSPFFPSTSTSSSSASSCTTDGSTSGEDDLRSGEVFEDEDSLYSTKAAAAVIGVQNVLSHDSDDGITSDEAFSTVVVGTASLPDDENNDCSYDNHDDSNSGSDDGSSDDGGDGDDDDDDDDEIDEVDSARQSFSSLSILLVDDSLPILKMLTNMLKGQGHTVVTAANGAESLDRLAEQHAAHNGMPFDLILMDMQMPVMDGLEATRRIRRMEVEKIVKSQYKVVTNTCADSYAYGIDYDDNDNNDDNDSINNSGGHIPVILHHRQNILALSANSDDDTIASAFEVGVDEFMPKPFAIKSLYDKLRIIRNKNKPVRAK